MDEEIIIIGIKLGVALMLLSMLFIPLSVIAHQEEPQIEIICVGKC